MHKKWDECDNREPTGNKQIHVGNNSQYTNKEPIFLHQNV